MLVKAINWPLIRQIKWLNETSAGKAFQHFFLRQVSYRWVRKVLSRQLLTEGAEKLVDLRPDKGVMFVCNHRSYFDYYAVSTLFFATPLPWIKRMVYPVRAGYFYERPLGLLLNLFAAAGAMYPPVWKDRRTKGRRTDIDFLEASLDKKGWVLAVHPEGGLNENSDPYTLAPFYHGAAQMILKKDVQIIPVFINGMDNSFGKMISRALDGTGKENPCIVIFGQPFKHESGTGDYEDYDATSAVSQLLHDKILELGQCEKQLRADFAKGQIDAQDARWLGNI